MPLKKDPIDKAVKRAGGALNLFVVAHDELQAANKTLGGVIEDHTAKIEKLEARVSYAKEQAAANAKVQEKLTEFIA